MIAGARSVAASAYVAGAPPRRPACLCRALCSAGRMILRTPHSPRWFSTTEKPPFRGGPGRRVAPPLHPQTTRAPRSCGCSSRRMEHSVRAKATMWWLRHSYASNSFCMESVCPRRCPVSSFQQNVREIFDRHPLRVLPFLRPTRES